MSRDVTMTGLAWLGLKDDAEAFISKCLYANHREVGLLSQCMDFGRCCQGEPVDRGQPIAFVLQIGVTRGSGTSHVLIEDIPRLRHPPEDQFFPGYAEVVYQQVLPYGFDGS
jgi:hypothetical protein